MLKIRQNFVLLCFCTVMVLADGAYSAGRSKGLEDVWDSERYIGLDEIKPGMEAYCLTEYGVAGIEKFGLEVVDVVRNINPSSSPGSKDAILVKGTDERFMHTGPVAGCSGSPVYIDGRLAGALAFTWTYAKDPLYGATPIAEMLAVGRADQAEFEAGQTGRMDLGIDFAAPIDFTEVEKQLSVSAFKVASPYGTPYGGKSQIINYSTGRLTVLPCPLITSGLPAGICEQLGSIVEPFGLMVVAGGGSGTAENAARAGKARLAPGAALAIPMVSGDISMSTSGTVTDVIGDKVYAFGHYLLGYGHVDLPMATAKVHTVVSNMASSFKLTSVLDTIGAVTDDEATGIVGRIGFEAKTIPLTIRVDRYNDTEKRLYNCRLVNNRLLTPFYLRMVIAGAAFQLGDLPQEHMVEYKVNIDIHDAEPIAFENVSSGMGLNEVVAECYSTIGLLLNNPYGIVDVESIDIDMKMAPRSVVSRIWSVDLSDSKVKPGRSIRMNVVLESVLAGKKQYQWDLEIPKDIAEGKYELTICGQRDYEQFLVKNVPHRFVAQNLPGLIEALNNSLQIDRGKLYCLLSLPAGGITIETAELPDLPDTRALLLADAKRTMRIRPFSHWIEKNLETDAVVIDKKVLQITVEK